MRYRWNKEKGCLEEMTERPVEPRVHFLTDSGYDGLRATDGADISTRAKWEAYAKEKKLTHMNDFKETWAKAEARRQDVRTTGGDHEARRKQIRAALEQPQRAVEAGRRARQRPTAINLRIHEDAHKE